MTRAVLVSLLCLLAWPARAEEQFTKEIACDTGPVRREAHWEVAATTAFQISGGGSEHIQLGVDGSYAFHRRLRLHLAGAWTFGWQTTHNENIQLLLQNPPATPLEASILLRQMLTVGVEGVPLTGQAMLLSLPIDLDLFLRLDAGAANSRVELQWSEESGGKTTYGAAGVRPVLGGSLGLRARAKNLVVRLALSTLSFSSKLDRVNGCTADELRAIGSGDHIIDGPCQAGDFADVRADARTAEQFVQNSKSGWTTLVMLGLSAGYVF